MVFMAVRWKEINGFGQPRQMRDDQPMNDTLPIVRTVSALRQQIDIWRHKEFKIGLVPTMGALHRGHLSLIECSRQHADRTIASIFINPRQFGPGEDIARYPRDENADIAQLASADCDLVYAPDVETMYPHGFATTISVSGMDDLCGLSRPGHFDGVATIVTKLLIQSGADIAVFGEKDFQQLTMIRRLVRDVDLGTTIVGAPLIRDKDGLALSSRNTYLSATERLAAVALPNALHTLRDALRAGADITACLDKARSDILGGGYSRVDYMTVRIEHDLGLPTEPKLTTSSKPMRILAAAYIGTTRLIDTVPV